MKPIYKALTLRASSIGDALMGKYFLENVHASSPNAACYMLVASRGKMIRDLFHAYPWLNVIEANRKSFKSLRMAYRVLKNTDLTLTQEAERPFSLPSKIFARSVTRKGGLYGFDDKWFGNSFIYDHIVPFTGEADSGGIILEEQKALTLAGVPIGVTDFTLQYTKDAKVLPRFGIEEKNYVLLHLFAGSPGREISTEKRLALVTLLREQLPKDIHILLSGSTKEEKEKTDAIAEAVSGVQSIAGQTTIPEFINLIASAKTVVSLNTGASHIAAHVGTPVVVLAQKGGKTAWWSEAMYKGKPVVLCNESGDDSARRAVIHPPSLEGIPNEIIVSSVVSMLQ